MFLVRYSRRGEPKLMITSRRNHGHSFPLLVFIAAVCVNGWSCSKQPDRGSGGLLYVPDAWPVTWPSTTEGPLVLFAHRTARRDVIATQCDQSGTYEAVANTLVRRASWTPEICDLNPDPGTVQGQPNGTTAILASGGKIFQWEILSGNISEIRLPNGLVASSPTLSHDAERVAFFGWFDSTPHLVSLYAMHHDGSDIRPVTALNGMQPASPPEWSPDRRRLSFSVFPDSLSAALGRAIIAIASVDRNDIRLLQPGMLPAWHPRGNTLAYIEVTDATIGHGHNHGSNAPRYSIIGTRLHVLDMDDGSDRVIVTAFKERPLESEAIRGTLQGPLVWSPDGTSMALSFFESGSSSTLIVGVKSKEMREVEDIPEE